MKTFTKRFFPAAMVIVMLSCLLCVGASASALSSDYICAYSADVTAKSGGRIVVTATVDGLGYMTQIGASRVVIYRSSDQTNYSSVATYSYENNPSMMTSGYTCNMDVVTYYGTPGYYYLAMVTCYAGNSSGYDTRLYTTAGTRAIS